MLTDPAATAGLVVREVRSADRDGVPTRVAVARRTYRTDRADLWDAVTSAERIPRWFLPVTGELREGGRYQLEGNAGGTVQECRAPESFAATWEFGEMVSWLTVTLTEADGGTVLELAHEAPVDPQMWTQFGPGAVGVGWDLGLMALGLHLESGAPVDPATGLAFPTTPEGAVFVGAAAAGWGDAAVADGDDEAQARAAARATAAFYTGTPEAG
ncbi:SRPBCC family protein [Klenkia terrae]|uniref:SRPBCC family protein n=1 Tax=Klenkia terrae TaxID=1052259 RepID=A0ABU8ED97_9ACTN